MLKYRARLILWRKKMVPLLELFWIQQMAGRPIAILFIFLSESTFSLVVLLDCKSVTKYKEWVDFLFSRPIYQTLDEIH